MLSFSARWPDFLRGRLPITRTLEPAASFMPFFKKTAHITSQVFDSRHVSERFDGERIILYDSFDMSAACPPWRPIDCHRTGTANADATRKPVRKRSCVSSLNFSDDVKHRLIRTGRYAVGFKSTVVGTSPNMNGQLIEIIFLHSK